MLYLSLTVCLKHPIKHTLSLLHDHFTDVVLIPLNHISCFSTLSAIARPKGSIKNSPTLIPSACSTCSQAYMQDEEVKEFLITWQLWSPTWQKAASPPLRSHSYSPSHRSRPPLPCWSLLLWGQNIKRKGFYTFSSDYYCCFHKYFI